MYSGGDAAGSVADKDLNLFRHVRGSRCAGLAAIALALLMTCTGCAPGEAPAEGGSSPAEDAGAPAMLDVSDVSAEGDTSVASTRPDAAGADTSHAFGSSAEAAALIGQIQGIIDGSGMDVNVAFVDLAGKVSGGCGATNPMAAASMIKLIVAEEFLQQAAEGTFDLDGYYTLKDSDIVGGTGSIGGYGVGAQVLYRELVEKMISESDNTAANILIDEVGMDAVNLEAARLGLHGTQLNRYMMDSDAISAGKENYVSAADVAMLLQMVYEGTFVDEESSALVLQALEQQQDDFGISDGLPADAVFAHKTGALPDVRHDGGIVEGDHPFILVVLCGGDGFNETGAFDAMEQIAQAAYAGIVEEQ